MAVRYQSNLSLQDEEKLSYAIYLEYLRNEATRVGYFKSIASAYRQCMFKF